MLSPMIDRLGKYRVTDVLGEGAMGVVYKGFDPDIHREVALKTMRAGLVEPGSGVSYADRFRNEARAAGRLQHPGIVAVHDFGRADGVDFIAMEYVPGHTLARYLQQMAAGRLVISDDDVLSIVGQLLEALHHAHEQGVWHRDIKPSNLIMTPGGRIKISDFGIARIEAAELTQVAGLIGTPMYMAPEQFQGRAIDRRVDLYAAGVVLYQLLTGRPPHTGAPEALAYKVVHEAAPPPSRLPGLDRLAPYDAVLARALAKEPAQRFAHAQAFRDALAAVVGRMHNAEVSDATVTALLPVPRPVAGERGTGSSVPTPFDAATLAPVVATLARHLGPMAQVLVKRAARESADLPALYAWLAAQVTDAGARQALAGQAAAWRTAARPGPAGSTASRAALTATLALAAGPAPGAGGGGAGVDAALQEAALRLLAQQLGPIARVLVKKAAAAAPQRQAFIARLAEALDDPAARQRLVDALTRLG